MKLEGSWYRDRPLDENGGKGGEQSRKDPSHERMQRSDRKKKEKRGRGKVCSLYSKEEISNYLPASPTTFEKKNRPLKGGNGEDFIRG